MSPRRHLGVALAALLGIATVGLAANVEADGKKGKKDAPAPVAADPPMTQSEIKLSPDGIAWGMSPKQVAVVVDKILDDEYKPLYQKVSPGVKMKELDAALAEEKSQFRRSRIDFGKLPVATDSGPLKGEYTYMNGEAMLTFTHGNRTRSFFFIKEKLWKVIEERKLKEGGALGKDFLEAASKLSQQYGVPGRVLAADPEKGRYFQEVDWRDAATHLRAIDRGAPMIALAYEDNATLANLSSLRTAKPVDDSGIDPAVAAAVAGHTEDSAGPPAGKDKAPPKKK